MNNVISEIRNTLQATNSRITEAEDRISRRQTSRNKWIREKNEKRIKRNEDNLRDFQGSMS